MLRCGAVTVELVRRSRLAIAGALLFGAACHPDPAVAPAAAASTPPAAAGAASQVIAPGERLVGTVYILGVEAARAEAEACRDAGGDVHVHLVAESVGIAATLQRARMEMDTVLAGDELRPIADWSDADVGGKLRRYDVRFRTGGYDYDYHRSTGPPVHERIRVADPQETVHDLLTGVLLLREWRPTPGTPARFSAVLGRHLWITDAVFRGPDVVIHADGPYPAVRIEGVTRKQHRDPKLRETAPFQVWFSDDPDRIPLRAKTTSDFGDIWLEMTEYHRGEPRPCREYARVISLPGDPDVDEPTPPPAPAAPPEDEAEAGW